MIYFLTNIRPFEKQINSSIAHSYMTNKRVLHIFKLIQTQQWYKLKNRLWIDYICHKSSVAKCSRPCSKSCKSIHSALHFVCQFHPPLDVVKMLYKAYPASIYEKDCKERNALHIACKFGCSPCVIKFLLEQNPNAAKIKDIENRIPFLISFKSYVTESNKDLRRANQDLLKVARELYDAYPDVSIDKGCSRKLFRLLISQEENKKKPNSHFEQRFGDLSAFTFSEDIEGMFVFVDEQSFVSSISLDCFDDELNDDKFNYEKSSDATQRTFESDTQ